MLVFALCALLVAALFLFPAYQRKGGRGVLRALGTFGWVALLVVADQLTKLWASTVLQPVGSIPFIPGVLEFRFTLNDGAAFSMLAGKQSFLVAFTGAALVVLAGYLAIWQPQKKLEHAAWILVLAGGIGNLIDRVLNGAVVDFWNVLFMDFAIFNFADVLVCVGIGLLVLQLIVEEIRVRKQKKQSGGAQDAAS